jgi:hypothetical protein
VIDEDMIDQLFILPFEGAEASAPSHPHSRFFICSE